MDPNVVKTVSVQELKKMMDDGKDFQLIDVREQNEYDFSNLGGELISLGDVPANANKVEDEKMVIIHCRSGKRSESAVRFLQEQHGFENLYNLTGGIMAWGAEIDPSVQTF